MYLADPTNVTGKADEEGCKVWDCQKRHLEFPVRADKNGHFGSVGVSKPAVGEQYSNVLGCAGLDGAEDPRSRLRNRRVGSNVPAAFARKTPEWTPQWAGLGSTKG